MFAVKDPEDSDVNSMFAAIEMYDELRKVEPNVEVATIAGSPSVGYQSDRILASQLEQVIEKVKPEEVILVSDGAEDEAVYPIISSRVRISSVRKVVVKQHRSAEGTFYVIKSAIREKHFLTPVALIILMLSGFALTSILANAFFPSDPKAPPPFASLILELTNIGISVTAIVIALYMIAYTYDWSRRLSKWYEDTANSLRTGRVRISFNVIALLILVIGGVVAYAVTSTAQLEPRPWPQVLKFASYFLWVATGSALASGVGRALDAYLSTGRFQYSYMVTGFSLLGITAAVYASLQVLHNLLIAKDQFKLAEELTQFGIWLTLAIAVGVGGGVFGRKVRRMERKLRAAKEAKLQADGGEHESKQKIGKKRID